ncbi:MAG: sodium:proton antiporter [Legionellales bacterium]|nr:sodium:proton antiporter [Legionellales bacterium]
MISFYNVFAIILTLSVSFAYINHRWLKMPPTIGIMCGALLLSAIMFATGLGEHGKLIQPFVTTLANLPFHDLLINGMLAYLLFAGALSVDMGHLKSQGWEVAILAMLGTIASTFLIGFLLYFLLHCFQINFPLINCFLFGALISPTDPIAVIAMFKDLKAPRHMATVLEGESLFNDGVGIVIFLTLYQAAYHMQSPTFSTIGLLFLQQTFGGLLLGALLGWGGAYLIKTSYSVNLAILVSIGVVTGGYAFAQLIGVSGPLAMVVAGIIIGNLTHQSFYTEQAKKDLLIFWEVLDEILNAILFLLIGFELLIMPFSLQKWLIGALCIPLVLLVRYLTVAMPVYLFTLKKSYYPYFVGILTWGGLRGGLAIALVLALPRDSYRDSLLSMTYMVVLFAIIVQGLSMKRLIGASMAKLAKNRLKRV